MTYVRPKYPSPSHPLSELTPPAQASTIHIRHPGYPDRINTLLNVRRNDDGGAHHETVRLSCAVIACNAWDGYLSEDRQGAIPAVDTPDPDIMLRKDSYYFQTHHPPSSHASELPEIAVADYAITPTFETWEYPRDRFPQYWEAMSPTSPIQQVAVSQACSLTRHTESVQHAHLVPAAQREWFQQNLMGQYIGPGSVDEMLHPVNTVHLRSDIHSIFDAKRFAIVPKHGKFVVHSFNELPGSEVLRLYHNVELHPMQAGIEFLLARFAFTVFGHLRTFLGAKVERRLRVRGANREWEERQVSAEDCARYGVQTAMQGKSRSASPRKRTIHEQSVQERGSNDNDDSADEEVWRGRKRRRTNDSGIWSSSQLFESTSSSANPSTPSSTSHILQPRPERALLSEKTELAIETREDPQERCQPLAPED